MVFRMQVPHDEAGLAELFARGESVLPGGVCSSTRRNRAWGKPVYAQHAQGARFRDIEGREFLDFSMSHGATLLGHAPECLREAIQEAWAHGVLCSMDTPFHVDLAEQLCRIVPCAERVRFTSSGSEATLHALRLCRAATGRDKIIRFFGHFHGYHEFTYIGGHPPADQLTASPPYRESAGRRIPGRHSRAGRPPRPAAVLRRGPVVCQGQPGGRPAGLRGHPGHLHHRQITRWRPAAFGDSRSR